MRGGGVQGFRGDEFYMRPWPALVGRTFVEILLMFEDAVPLGIKSPGRGLVLNPKGSCVFAAGRRALSVHM